MLQQTISILGCGWLGLPLAEKFLQLGFHVKGSTTSQTRLQILAEKGVTPFLIDCLPNKLEGDIASFLNSKFLFLNIPFRRDLTDPFDYFEMVKQIVFAVESSSVEFLVFASSTSVYPEDLQIANENDRSTINEPRSQVLIDCEDLLLRNKKFRTTVIRFAGLFGGTRQFKTVVSEGHKYRSPETRLNLIYLDDCVEIVSQIFCKGIQGEIFNACCNEHPTRREFYEYLAKKNGFPIPQFDQGLMSKYKIVSNEKIKKALNFDFQYSSPLHF